MAYDYKELNQLEEELRRVVLEFAINNRVPVYYIKEWLQKDVNCIDCWSVVDKEIADEEATIG